MKALPLVCLVGALSTGCDQAPPVLANLSIPDPPDTFELPPLPPGRTLVSYSWEGVGGVIPCPDGAPERLAFGQLGRTADTGLYLTGDAAPDEERALQPAGWTLESRDVGTSPGRFGKGLLLGPSSLLSASLPPDAPAPRIWTLEFWIYSADPAAHDLFSVPGLITLYCAEEGRLELKMPGAGPAQKKGSKDLFDRNPTLLTPGAWHHVGLVLDLVDARGVRLVVDGEPHGVRLDPALVTADPRELRFGDVFTRDKGMSCVLDEVRFLTRNTSTQELADHWRARRDALERLRLVYADGEEELLVWREPSTAPVLGGATEWARADREHAFAGPRGLEWSAESWHEIECPTRPMARTTHALAAIGDRRLLVFAGETRDTHWGRGPNTNDLWMFDAALPDWERIDTPLAPSPRCHVPMAYSPDHDLVLLVGGWWQGGWWTGAEEEKRTMDTWVFHVGERRWEERTPRRRVRGGSDHWVVYLPSVRRFMLITPNSSAFYDPENDRWSPDERYEIQGGSERDENVNSFMAALEPHSGRIFLFGGQLNDGFSNRTAWLDPRTNVMQVLDPPVRPPERVRGAMAWDPSRERFVLFGGVRDQRSQRFDDLWTFDPATERWSEIPRGIERPSARGGFFGMAYDEEGGGFVVPFGRNAFERWQDETLLLQLDETQSGRASVCFDRAAFSDQATWFSDCDTPGDAQVRFRYRTSEDGLRFGAWSDACPAEGRFVLVEVELRPGSRGESPAVRSMGWRTTS